MQDKQKVGGKADMLMEKKGVDNMLPNDATAIQNMTEEDRRKSYSEVVEEGVRRKARVFVGESIVRKPDKAQNKGDNVIICFSGTKIEAIKERAEKMGLF